MKLRSGRIVATIALALCTTAALAQGGPATTAIPESRCRELAAIGLEGVEIVSAKLQDGGSVAGRNGPAMSGPNSGPPVSGLPAFCRVVGRIHPEPGSDIGFEVWLPSEDWDGRLSGAGSPGAAGSILYYMLAASVRGGQAGVSNDGGHRGDVSDASWAPGHPERVRDFGWRAAHLSTVAAKALVVRYYRRPADHSYFIGISNGGRQALVEASRFPDDYDGILARAPATDWTLTRMAQLWPRQIQSPSESAIHPAQAKLLQTEVLRQCDAVDGQLDGLIDDPRHCHFNPARLACGTSSSTDCFAPPQLAALERIYAGRKDRAGRWVARPFLPAGSEVADPLFGWDSIIFAQDKPADTAAGHLVQSLDGQTIATVNQFDFDRDPVRLKAVNANGGLDPSPNMQRFFARGGKLIIWHGWADADIPPELTFNYYAQVLRASGSRAVNSMRLFMIPGLQHGTGGKGVDLFGQLFSPPRDAAPESNIAAALQAWVENDRIPDSIVGKRHSIGATEAGAPPAQPPRERLLCAYPKRAMLTAGADRDRGSSYSCSD